MKVNLKVRKTGATKTVTKAVWELMRRDGRSRHYSVVSEEEPTLKTSAKKQEKEEVIIEDVGKRAYPFNKKKKDEPAEQDETNKNPEKQE